MWYTSGPSLPNSSTADGLTLPHHQPNNKPLPAQQILRLKPGRRFCTLGRLAHEVGWGHRDLVQRLEAKRKIKAEAFYQQKKAATASKALAERKAAGELKSVNSVLEVRGERQRARASWVVWRVGLFGGWLLLVECMDSPRRSCSTQIPPIYIFQSFGYHIEPTPAAERIAAPAKAKKVKAAPAKGTKTPPKGASPSRPVKA